MFTLPYHNTEGLLQSSRWSAETLKLLQVRWLVTWMISVTAGRRKMSLQTINHWLMTWLYFTVVLMSPAHTLDLLQLRPSDHVPLKLACSKKAGFTLRHSTVSPFCVQPPPPQISNFEAQNYYYFKCPLMGQHNIYELQTNVTIVTNRNRRAALPTAAFEIREPDCLQQLGQSYTH